MTNFFVLEIKKDKSRSQLQHYECIHPYKSYGSLSWHNMQWNILCCKYIHIKINMEYLLS